MLSYKRYPSCNDYENVAQTIVQKYAHLKSPIGSPHGAIKSMLQNRFKEFRRSKVKRKVSEPHDLEPSGKRPGITTLILPPSPPNGEDEVSFKRHNSLLLAEKRKTHPNMEMVKDLMHASFAMRRKDILENVCHVSNVLEKYPFLGIGEQLIIEMNRIKPFQREQWKQVMPKFVNQAGIEAKASPRISKAIGNLLDTEPSSLVVLFVLCTLLPDPRCKPGNMSLIHLTQEDNDLESIVKARKVATPYILVVGSMEDYDQMFLVIDGNIIMEVSEEDCVLVLLSSFFVFNICYPRGCSNVFSLLEVVVFGESLDKLSPTVKQFLANAHAQS